MHVNIGSLPHNYNEFLFFIQRQVIGYNIILLTETWLTDADDQLYPIPGYCHLSINRLNRKGGGIRIYYLADLTLISVIKHQAFLILMNHYSLRYL